MKLGIVTGWIGQQLDRLRSNETQPPKVELDGPAAYHTDSWARTQMAESEQKLALYQSKATIGGSPAPGKSFEAELATRRSEMRELEDIDSGESQFFLTDTNPAKSQVHNQYYDKVLDGKFRGSSDGNFAYSKVESDFDSFGVPHYRTSSVIYDGKTLTVLSNSVDAYGEGTLTARTLSEGKAVGESLDFG